MQPGGLISIHPLREEGDLTGKRKIPPPMNFYPRPPRGGRQPPEFVLLVFIVFLSTPSARRATDFGLVPVVFLKISIHALREEGDMPELRQ